MFKNLLILIGAIILIALFIIIVIGLWGNMIIQIESLRNSSGHIPFERMINECCPVANSILFS